MALSKDILVTLPKVPESDDDDSQVEIFDVTNILMADKLNGRGMNSLASDSNNMSIKQMIKDLESEQSKDNSDVNDENDLQAIEVIAPVSWPSEFDKDIDSDMITNVSDRVNDIDPAELEGSSLEIQQVSISNNSPSSRDNRHKFTINLIPKAEELVSTSVRQPVDEIWDFIKSQDDVASDLAKRKALANREYNDHKAWCERQIKAKANYVPDPAVGDFVDNEITLVSFDDSETDDAIEKNCKSSDSPEKVLDFKTPEEAELYYKTASKALLQQRLAFEAQKLEEERIANLEIARQRRIQARKEEAELKKKRQEALRVEKKHAEMVNVLLASTFPANGALFYSPNISHQQPISCLPLKKNIWDSHIHLTCTLATWALPAVANMLCFPQFRAIQLCQIEAIPRFHLVLELTENSEEWEQITRQIIPNGLGAKFGEIFKVTAHHDVFDLSQLSLYSRAIDGKGQKYTRILENPEVETCIGIFRDVHNVEAVLQVLKSPNECGAKLVGMRTVYMTKLQKSVSKPMFNVLTDSFNSQMPILVICIAGRNCREKWENFLGPLDPDLARRLAPRSIRAVYGRSKEDNVIWISRTSFDIEPKIVRAEASFFFAGRLPNKEKETAEEVTKRLVNAIINI